jgi:xylulokinase
MRKLLLAIDQGTSGAKITIFDTDGQVIAENKKCYDTFYPAEGHVEQDCEQWWQVIAQGIKEIFQEHRVQPKEIKGIGIDGTSWAMIPVDQEGNVLHKTLIWLDRRATDEAMWMKEVIPEEALIEVSGNPVDAGYITPKILWFKNHQPDLYRETFKFLQSNGFLVYRLTGEYSQDLSQGYGFHFFDMKSGTYNLEIIEALGLDPDKFVQPSACHTVVGQVTPEAALLTGLEVGTPVVAGGLDAACCTLGAGVIDVGQTQEQGGQAGGMSIALDKPKNHPRLILGYHVVPDLWLLQGGTTGGGGTINWFHREFGNVSESFATMSQMAEEIQPGSDGVIFLPYMKGERSPLWNANAKGIYYGLAFDKSKGHFIRSTMEGVAYSLRHNLDVAKEVGVQVEHLYSVGGSANSKVWTQMKADITGCRIDVPYADYATGLGAAILAGVGVGLYSDFHEAVKKTVHIQTSYQPNDEVRPLYNKGYALYRQLSACFMENFWT